MGNFRNFDNFPNSKSLEHTNIFNNLKYVKIFDNLKKNKNENNRQM
jgi:hypothetical protein